MARQPQPDQPAVIRGADNQTVKLVRSLRQRKTREAERLFVVEGKRLVHEALARGARPRTVLVSESELHLGLDLAYPDGQPVNYRLVETRLFDSLSDTVTPQGILAVLPIPELSIPRTDCALVIVADRMSDPGNLGTLIRVSAGAGATAVVLTEISVDPYNPKVVRAGMGAHFHVPLLWLDDVVRGWIESTCENRVLAEASSDLDYDHVDWTVPSAILVGPETGGFSDEARNLATSSARIPLASDVESINAAVAGAVMLFEANRQRRAVPPAMGRDKGKD
jgi:TrmH family RNA methyltransferase